MPLGDVLSERLYFTMFLASKLPQSNNSSTFFLFISTGKVLWKFHALLKWLKENARDYTSIYTNTHTHTYRESFSEENVFMCFRNVTARPSLTDYDRAPLLCSNWWESQAVPVEGVVPLDALSLVFSTSFLHLELPGCGHFLSWLPYNAELLLDAGIGWG